MQVGSDVVFQNEEYELWVLLTVPESQTNFDIGNFDVSITFSDENRLDGMVTNTQSMLKYSSPLLRVLKTITFMFPLLLGWTDEAQIVPVLLSASFVNHTGLNDLVVEISPKELQIYKAELQVSARLSGIRSVMHRYFYSSMLICISFLFSVNCTILTAVFYLRYYKPPTATSEIVIRRSAHFQKIEMQNEYELIPRPEAQKFPTDFSHILKMEESTKTWSQMIVFN